MDIADTTVAIRVDTPVKTRRTVFRAEPEPDPVVSGTMLEVRRKDQIFDFQWMMLRKTEDDDFAQSLR